MAFSLYEINSQIEQAWGAAVDPDTGEIINEEALQVLDGLTMQREEKLENLALFYKNLSAEAEALKAEKMRLAARQAAAEKRQRVLKSTLKRLWIPQGARRSRQARLPLVGESRKASRSMQGHSCLMSTLPAKSQSLIRQQLKRH